MRSLFSLNTSSNTPSSKIIKRGKRPTNGMTDSLSDLETADNYISTGSSIKKGNVTRKTTKMSMFNFPDLSGLDVSDD